MISKNKEESLKDLTKIPLRRKKIKELLTNKFFYIGLGVFLFGFILNQLSSVYLYNKYKELPVLHDAVLDIIPVLKLSWVYDIFAILSILLFVIYAYKKQFDKIPYFFLLFGIILLFRSVFVVLTPFANPDRAIYNGILQNSPLLRMGVYPSGHTGATFLAFLLSKGICRYVLLFFSIFVVISLFLARGHYSIDIFSAIVFAYAIYSFGEKHFKDKFTMK